MQKLLESLFPQPHLLGTELSTYGYVSEINEDVKLKIKDIGKKVKYVAGWTIHLVNVNDSEHEYLDKNKLYPIILDSSALIDERFTLDSHQKWTQSSYLKEFHLQCLFETKNTIYVLCNKGIISDEPIPLK